VFFRAHTFFLSHCVGNASGTNEAIQLAERRTVSSGTTHGHQASFSSTLVDQIRSSSIQQNINTNNTEMIVNINPNNKKSLQSDQQTSILAKRTSDSLVTTTATANEDQNRRRSSLSTELNISDRSTRKGFNSTSTTINSTKDLCTNGNIQINKSSVTYSANGNSNEKVILIDTTAVSCSKDIIFLLLSLLNRYMIQ
jgi:hypothetical protein